MEDHVSAEVLRLLLDERLSTKEAGERLGLSPNEVMAIKNGSQRSRSSARSSVSTEIVRIADDREQIEILRRQVRMGLLELTRPGQVQEFRASALVRLWQLVEDARLLEGVEGLEEDPFEVPEEALVKIFEILDGV